MKKAIRLAILLSTILLLLLGCADHSGDEAEYIEVEKRTGDDSSYKHFKEVTDQEQVKKVHTILRKASFKKMKVDMARTADYRFMFQYKDDKADAKAATYELWIGPSGDTVELSMDDSKYVHLDEEHSKELIEIITKN